MFPAPDGRRLRSTPAEARPAPPSQVRDLARRRWGYDSLGAREESQEVIAVGQLSTWLEVWKPGLGLSRVRVQCKQVWVAAVTETRNGVSGEKSQPSNC